MEFKDNVISHVAAVVATAAAVVASLVGEIALEAHWGLSVRFDCVLR